MGNFKQKHVELNEIKLVQENRMKHLREKNTRNLIEMSATLDL